MISLMVLIKRRPEWDRSVKPHILFPIIYLLFALLTVGCAFYKYPYDGLYCMVFVITCIPVYLLMSFWKRNRRTYESIKCLEKFTMKITHFLQKLFLVSLPTSEEHKLKAKLQGHKKVIGEWMYYENGSTTSQTEDTVSEYS